MTAPSDLPCGPVLDALCEALQRAAQAPGAEDRWPAAPLDELARTGVTGWVIPRSYGGSEIGAAELMRGYEQLARACLTTTFILTQRNAACQRIAASANERLKAELLPPLAAGDCFATVGISHLTTSRQHLRRPVVAVRREAGRFVLQGSVPWVTGAQHAAWIVTGGTCEDGRQVLLALPTRGEGVTRLEPPPLLALNGSQTGSIELRGAVVDDRCLLAGPVERAMQRGEGGGAGSLTTSALAIGAAAASLAHLEAEAAERPDLGDSCAALTAERALLSCDVQAAARGESAREGRPLTTEAIRTRANSLVLRSAQAHLAASKGAGFVKGHPAERAVREAMFFLVWSCPQPVLAAALREFACTE